MERDGGGRKESEVKEVDGEIKEMKDRRIKMKR